MMRILVLAPFLLAACSSEPAGQAATTALYAGAGRDRLCLEGDRAGFITYGDGAANCTARGRIERSTTSATLIPDGDPDCRISIALSDADVVIGKGGEACAYYCGPGTEFAGRRLRRDAEASPAVDFAGDPLC